MIMTAEKWKESLVRIANAADYSDVIGLTTLADDIDRFLRLAQTPGYIPGTMMPQDIPKEEAIQAVDDKYGLLSDIRLLSKRILREFRAKYEQYGEDIEPIIQSMEGLANQLDSVSNSAEGVLSQTVG